jgi:hypothetical protein
MDRPPVSRSTNTRSLAYTTVASGAVVVLWSDAHPHSHAANSATRSQENERGERGAQRLGRIGRAHMGRLWGFLLPLPLTRVTPADPGRVSMTQDPLLTIVNRQTQDPTLAARVSSAKNPASCAGKAGAGGTLDAEIRRRRNGDSLGNRVPHAAANSTPRGRLWRQQQKLQHAGPLYARVPAHLLEELGALRQQALDVHIRCLGSHFSFRLPKNKNSQRELAENGSMGATDDRARLELLPCRCLVRNLAC